MNPTTAFSNLHVNHGFGPIPKKRQNRAELVSTLLSFVIVILMFTAFTEKKEYDPVSPSTNDSTTAAVICKPKRNYHFIAPIFIWTLNLVGIIIGKLMHRFCLIFEEYFHLESRYNGSKRKMLAACFSDFPFRVVSFVALVAVIIVYQTLATQGVDYFKLEYTVVILNGIGNTSLLVYLLGLNTLSRVEISSLLENNNRYVGGGFAWSYYFGYLKIILPELEKRIDESTWANRLASKKLFILIPRNCYVYGELGEEDAAIELAEGGTFEYKATRAGIVERSYHNTIYKVTASNNEVFYVLAEYATPLSSLYDMSEATEAKLNREDRDEQAKLLLRTLEAILDKPKVRNKCKLIPYGLTDNYKLSDVIAEAVREENSAINVAASSV